MRCFLQSRCRPFAFQPKHQPLHQFRLQAQNLVALAQHVLHPDLRPILNINHLRAKSIMCGHGQQRASQHQVCLQSFTHLRGAQAAASQREYRIPRHDR
jgi:hypothetical protein